MPIRFFLFCVYSLVFVGTNAAANFAPPLSNMSMPSFFVKNKGQYPNDVIYVASGSNYQAVFKKTSVDFVFKNKRGVVDFRFVLDKAILPETLVDSVSKTNYFYGGSKQWVKQAPTSTKIRYSGLYKDIDLDFYFREGKLEYDFVVHANANVADIKLLVTGLDNFIVVDSGDIKFIDGQQQLVQQAPQAFQRLGADNIKVNAEYRLAGNVISFKVGSYDRSKQLVIDPVIDFQTYFGGTTQDNIKSLVMDPSGNGDFYIAGSTITKLQPQTSDSVVAIESGFPNTTASVQGAKSCQASDIRNVVDGYASDFDIFLAKFASNGTLLFSTYIGGCGNDGATDMVVKDVGKGTKVFLTGFTSSLNFPKLNAPQQRLSQGGSEDNPEGDAFVMSLSSTDGSIEYSTYLGGEGKEGGSGIAVDDKGRIYVVGYTHSRIWDAAGACESAGVLPVVQCKHSDDQTPRDDLNYYNTPFADGFVAQIGATGLINYVSYLGGRYDDWAEGVILQQSVQEDTLYIGGNTASPDFPMGEHGTIFRDFHPGVGACSNAFPVNPDRDSHECRDVFVIALSSDGKKIHRGAFLGGARDESIADFALDSSGSIVLTGITQSDTLTVEPNGFIDIENISDASIKERVVDEVALREYIEDRFPLVNPLTRTTDPNSIDAFLTKFSSDMTTLQYSTIIGGSDRDIPKMLLVHGSQTYLAGHTQSLDFPSYHPDTTLEQSVPGKLSFKPAPVGNDGFIVKISEENDGSIRLDYSLLIGGERLDQIDSIGLMADNRLVYVGSTFSTQIPRVNEAIATNYQQDGDLFFGLIDQASDDGREVDLVLTVTKQPKATEPVNKRLDYTFNISNKGSVQANNAQLLINFSDFGIDENSSVTSAFSCQRLNPLPPICFNADGVEYTAEQKQYWSAERRKQCWAIFPPMFCDIGIVLPGEENSQSLDFSVIGTKGATVEVTASLMTSTISDQDNSNNQKTVTTSVRATQTNALGHDLLLLFFLFAMLRLVVNYRQKF